MSSSVNRGSIWGKWDLHFHTPSSYDYQNSSITNQEIVDALKSHSISVVAITDHHVIDVARIQELQRLAGNNLTILPGIEFRSELGGSDSIHFIGIFAEDSDYKTIWEKLSGKLDLTRGDIASKGNDKLFCPFEKSAELIHSLGGIVSIHAGSKSNTIERITNALPYKEAQKAQLLKSIDIFEMGKIADCMEYRKNVFPNISKHPPMVLCSDSHDITSYGGRPVSWIKAEPTFCGLRRTLAEPDERVSNEGIPAKLVDVDTHKQNYIDSITLSRTGQSTTHHWFDGTLHLNPGLVAIIGKKGSGKSALTDILALIGRSHIPSAEYSFLRQDKFRKRALAKDYSATIKWLDETQESDNLNNPVDIPSAVERVTYLPQRYVETICNEAGVSTMFQDAIHNVVFSYIPKEDRLDVGTLTELINVRTGHISESLVTKRSALTDKVKDFCTLYRKLNPSHQLSLENKLKRKQDELKAITLPKPVTPPKNKLDDSTKKELEQLQARLDETEASIKDTNLKIKNKNDVRVALQQIKGKLGNLEQLITSALHDIRPQLAITGLKVDKLIKISIENKVIDAEIAKIDRAKSALSATLGKEETENTAATGLIAKRQKIEEQYKAAQGKLDKAHGNYQLYIDNVKTIEIRRAQLTGNPDDKSLETIKSIEKELEYVKKSLNADLTRCRGELNDITKQLFRIIDSKSGVYSEIYSPLEDFLKLESANQQKVHNVVSFSVGMVPDKKRFTDGCLSRIDRSRDGSFQRKKEAIERSRSITDKHSLRDENSVIELINEFLDNLEFDRTADEVKPMRIDDQLLSSKGTFEEFIAWLYGLEYLDVKYKLQFNGKDLNEDEFSPGERGAILLIFYLLIDKGKAPLIIDQPEENLDNESVFQLLVPYIKKAKRTRQIIVVTHNPNLAVVCDAEQIVHATMDKKVNEIRYASGAIEDPKTNQAIADILEGTIPAFSKREEAYVDLLTDGKT